MSKGASSAEQAWAMIEQDKRRDEFLRKISRVAWIVTFVIVLLFTLTYAALLGYRVIFFGLGRAWDQMELLKAALPFFASLGVVCILVATLSTIGMFTRVRTASLAEIQLRLAALEDILTRDGRGPSKGQ